VSGSFLCSPFPPTYRPGLPNASPRPDYIQAAVPFFFLLIVVEFFVGAKRLTKGGKYRVSDSVTSISAGIFQNLGIAAVPAIALLNTVPYDYINKEYGLVTAAWDSPALWVVALLAVDFCYLWAGHVPHHSGESYNFSTALRQGFLQPIGSAFFYYPLALFIPTELALLHRSWNTLYQFWVHTTVVRRLGPLELVLMTPSHHRVHHDRRVHKNYGGLLIVWDRIFGSFVDECELEEGTQHPSGVGDPSIPDGDERVVYGILKGPESWNPFTVQFHHLVDIGSRFVAAPGLRAKWNVLWRGPGLRPGMTRTNLPAMNPNVVRLRYVAHHSPGTAVYFMLQLAVAVALGSQGQMMHARGECSEGAFYTMVALVFWALGSMGAIMNGSHVARGLEVVRLVAATVLSAWALYRKDVFGAPNALAVFGAVNAASAVLVAMHPRLLHCSSTVAE